LGQSLRGAADAAAEGGGAAAAVALAAAVAEAAAAGAAVADALAEGAPSAFSSEQPARRATRDTTASDRRAMSMAAEAIRGDGGRSTHVRSGAVSHPRSNILPAILVAQARAATREVFVEAFGDTKLLVIRLDPKTPELELGLSEAASAPSAAWRPRSGITGVGTMISPISDQFLRAASTSFEARRQLSSKKLQALFSTRPHFLLPLRKRAGEGSADRLVVGRSTANDVVLRHPSVSKVHATLEWDEAGIHYVSDEGSTNNTQLDGRVLAPTEPATFGPGDVIRFGDVETFVCMPETFWDALST
jgi:hypothetical protein